MERANVRPSTPGAPAHGDSGSFAGASSPPQAALRVFGVSLWGVALLLAVGTLVVLVSLPRLRALTVRTGELDARSTLRLLAERLELPEPGTTLGQALSAVPGLRRPLQDARLFSGGRILAHHGYCFELLNDEVGPVLVAWPQDWGQTGFAAFALRPDGLLGHPNAEGHWNGVRGLQVDLAPEAWQPLSRR